MQDSGTARIINSFKREGFFVSDFHLLVNFILSVGFFHMESRKHCLHTSQTLFLEEACLVSIGKLKKKKFKKALIGPINII